MELQGTVRNVVDFGAFVDIGVKQDGLVHISKFSNRFVKHPLDIVSVGDVVTVWVDSVDIKKGRVALTMLSPSRLMWKTLLLRSSVFFCKKTSTGLTA